MARQEPHCGSPSESTLLPLCETKTKASRGRKAPRTVNIHLLPASTHVLTPRNGSQEQPLAAGDSSTGTPATPWGRSLARWCCRPSAPRPGKQGRLRSRLTAAVTSSWDAVAEPLLGEKAVSPQRDKRTGSCWGRGGESPAAWGRRCPAVLRQERCPGCGGRASRPSASPASGRPPGRQGAAPGPPASSISPQRRHAWETKRTSCMSTFPRVAALRSRACQAGKERNPTGDES